MHAECCFDAFIKEFNFYCVTAINKTISGGCASRFIDWSPLLSTNETDNDDCTF